MDIRKRALHLWRVYGTLNNIVITVALVVAASLVWGAISTMETNFAAQKSVDDLKRQEQLTQLEVDTLKFQQNYYKSDEYKDLSARQTLGLASPGEKVLLLPPNSAAVKQADSAAAKGATTTKPTASESNFDQWMTFLGGGDAKALQN